MAARSAAPPIAGDAAARFLPVVVGLVVFLAALSVAALLLLGVVMERWESALAGTMTVQVMPGHDAAETGRRLDAVADLLRRTPGVLNVDPLSDARMAGLLAPWLGQGLDVADLPLPRLVAVRLRPGETIDVDALRRSLASVAAGTEVDDHGLWLGRLVRYARTAELVATAVLLLVGAVAVLTVAALTIVRLAIHREVIDILHMLGATDGFVARQFEASAFRLGLGGGIVGAGAAALAVVALSRVPGTGLEGTLLGAMPAMPTAGWVSIALLPVASGVVALVTARITVLIRLGRQP